MATNPDTNGGSQNGDKLKIYFLPNLMTAGNLFCGFAAVLRIIEGKLEGQATDVVASGRYKEAIGFILGACVFDLLDGRLARLGGHESPFGREFDSLADIVSFGVAPAAMAFAAGLRGGWDALFLIYFVGCGISRLARYNVSASAAAAAATKVTHFEGFPIPSSLLLVGGTAVLALLGRLHDQLPFGAVSVLGMTLHPIAIVFGLHGSLMVSKTVRIPKP